MYIIIDSVTREPIEGQSPGTNNKFPDGNVPGVTCEVGQEIVKIQDGSVLCNKILNEFNPWKFNETKDDIELLVTQEEIDAQTLVANNNAKVHERDSLMTEVLWVRDRHRDELDLINLGELTETTLTSTEFNDLLIYIQDLRDVPQNNYIIPTKPSFL